MKTYLITTENSKRKIPSHKDLPDLEVIYALNHPIPYISLFNTVMYILEINIGKPVMIFEDDVLFRPSFNMEKLQNITDSIGTNVDVINTGVFEFGGKTFPCIGYDDRLIIEKWKGNQGTIYLPTALFKLRNVEPGHIDLIIAEKCKTLCTYPFMTYQQSDNNSKISMITNMEDVYEETENKIKSMIEF